jgi:HlyD family secretion protein
MWNEGVRRGQTLVVLLLAASLVAACGAPAAAQGAAPLQTVEVTRGAIEATIGATGTVAAQADLNLLMPVAGTIKEIFIKPGDRVQTGQPLVRIDDSELRTKLAQAEANLASALARYTQVKAGATATEIANAEASVRSAEARYAQAARGTTTAQDIANAEAALRSAQARLEATRAGTTTPADIANAEAAVQTAELKLRATLAGTDPRDIDTARQQVEAQRDNRAKTASQLANAKEQARLAIDQAADALRSAQSAYGATKLIYDEAVRTGKDPNVPGPCPPTNRNCRDLTDARTRQYKADYEAKLISLRQAESTLEARRLAYEDAKQQEVAGLQAADRTILEAQANLDKLMAPPAADVVAQAEAALVQARTTLEKLKEPVKATDIAQAEAAVAQARAQLEKLRRGPEAEDLVVAQASVDQARASLDDLKAGPKEADLATALAALKQAEAARDEQQVLLGQALLTAPFAGTIAALNGQIGQQALTSGATPLVALVNDAQLRIDVRVAESDVGRLSVNQEARVTLDALPEESLPGRVIFVAPKATVEQNVTSYLVTVALAPNLTGVKPGMTANVTVTVARKQNVLLVPNRAIRTVARERQVDVRYKGLTLPIPIQVGMVGDAMSEVTGGLREGDVLVLNARTTTRVTPNVGGPGGGVAVPAVKTK